MQTIEKKFLHEVQLFRVWAATMVDEKRGMEWECNYDEWRSIYQAAAHFLGGLEKIDADKLAETTIKEMLYILAADNNCQGIAAEVARYPEKLLFLAQAAINGSSANAKWQLAVELGKLHTYKSQAESLLAILARDEDEYTRRRALGALAEANSILVNDFIGPAWASGHQYQRMMVLSALHKIASPDLEKYLVFADSDGREYLVALAERLRRGETD